MGNSAVKTVELNVGSHAVASGSRAGSVGTMLSLFVASLDLCSC